jgi:DNA-binding IclR family transcriptional regulator
LTRLANEARFSTYRTDASAILAQIADARRRGYNVREAGLVQGTKSISTWIRISDHRPVAAVTVTAVRRRFGPRREVELAELLLDAARSIEQPIRRDAP